jgi:hypothetical protein
MERLFSPCTRYRDLLETQGRLEVFRGHTEPLQELNLEVSTEELLSAERAFTYVDLHDMSGDRSTVLWLTPHAAIVRLAAERVNHFFFQLRHYWLERYRPYRFIFSADGKGVFALARSPEYLFDICDVVLRLLARSVVSSVILHSLDDRVACITALLVDMMKVNTSIHTIHLTDRSHNELFRAEIVPYLESNRLRPRVHAIQTARPMAYRTKVLGRALHAVRTDANSLWMLLSGNPEAAFLSTAATTTPATNLPTPATTAVATSDAATSAYAATSSAAVAVTASWVASTTGASAAGATDVAGAAGAAGAAGNLANPTVVQKCKACP